VRENKRSFVGRGIEGRYLVKKEMIVGEKNNILMFKIQIKFRYFIIQKITNKHIVV